jgi:hypothetical protein
MTTSCPSGSRKTENQSQQIYAYIFVCFLLKVLNAQVQSSGGAKDSCTTEQQLNEDSETVRGQLKCLLIGVFDMFFKSASNS